MFTTTNKKDLIYQKYNDLDLFKHFIPDVSLTSNISSPLRSDDNTPSFRLYITKNNTICFVDFALGTGNIWEYLKLKYGWTYKEALDKVYDSLKGVKIKSKVIDYKKVNEKTIIDYNIVKAQSHDFKFWNNYFTTDTVRKLQIAPINMYFINGYSKVTDDYTYVFKVGSRVKIYQPYGTPKYFGNTNSSSIQGWHLLNSSNKKLKLVSSLKEIGVCYEQGIQAIAPNSESSLIPPKIFSFLKSIWDIEILYDWDKAGRRNAKKHSNIYNVPISPLQYLDLKSKDISDFRKDYGFYNTKEILRNE